MKSKKFLLLAALALIALALMGCGLFSAISGAKKAVEEAQTLVPTVEAAATSAANAQPQQGSEPTQAQQSPTEAPHSALVTVKTPDKVKDLKSFQIHYVLTVEFPKRNQKFVIFDINDTEVRNDKGQVDYHAVVKMPIQNTSFEGIRVGDKVWVSDGENWVVGTEDQLTSLTHFSSSSDLFFSDLFGKDVSELKRSNEDWKYAGTAKVNGVETMHFTLKENAVQAFSTDQFNMLYSTLVPGLNVHDLKATSATGDVYIAKDGLLVKGSYILTGVGKTDDGKEETVKIVYQYDVTHINDPNLKVEPPKGTSASVKAPFPLPPNAKLKLAAGQMQVFEVQNTTVDDVMSFFAEALPKAGYKISNKMGGSEGWQFGVTGKNETYIVMVGPAPDNPANVDIAISK